MKVDSELVVPIGIIDDQRREEMRRWLDWAKPSGLTPLVHSVLQAKKDFNPTVKAPKLVILISDGQETCGGRLTDISRAYKKSDAKFVIHVVGFDIKDTIAKRTLQKIAQVGGGNYYHALNSSQLIKVLKSAVRSTGFTVLDGEGNSVAGRGVINGGAVELKPGKYRVRLAASKNEPFPVVLGKNQSLILSLNEQGILKASQ